MLDSVDEGGADARRAKHRFLVPGFDLIGARSSLASIDCQALNRA
jgi:hypothetical protein